MALFPSFLALLWHRCCTVSIRASPVSGWDTSRSAVAAPGDGSGAQNGPQNNLDTFPRGLSTKCPTLFRVLRSLILANLGVRGIEPGGYPKKFSSDGLANLGVRHQEGTDPQKFFFRWPGQPRGEAPRGNRPPKNFLRMAWPT